MLFNHNFPMYGGCSVRPKVALCLAQEKICTVLLQEDNLKSGSTSGVDDADGIPKPDIQQHDETQPEPQAQPQSFEGNTLCFHAKLRKSTRFMAKRFMI